jgi:guanine nucleotide-binding protein G(i) subunit alpha
MGNAVATKSKEDATGNAEDTKLHKIIMLGTGESGKSTIFKQVTNLTGPSFSKETRQGFIRVMSETVIRTCHSIIKECRNKSPTLLTGEKAQLVERILNLLPHGNVTREIANDIQIFWSDPVVKQEFLSSKLASLVQKDSIALIFENIVRLSSTDYIPCDEEVIRARVRTTGIVESKCDIGGFKFLLWDSGGQRNERKKWIHMLENVSLMTYMVSIGDFDELCFEDDTVNRMEESVACFEEVVNSRFLPGVPIVLVFTKYDVFQQKCQTIDISLYFPDYTHGRSVEKAREFFADKHLKQVKDFSRPISVHYLNGVDPEDVKNFILNIQENFLNPGPEDAQLCRSGDWLKRIGRHEEALEFFQKCIQIERGSIAFAYNGKGETLFQMGKESEALECFEKAIQIDGTLSNAYSNKASVLNDFARFEESIKESEKALVFDPRNSRAHSHLAKSLMALKMYGHALKSAEEAIRLDPVCAEAYHTKSEVLRRDGKFKEALDSAQKSLELKLKSSAEVYCTLGKVLVKIGKLSEALKAAEKALELSENSVHGYHIKGDVLAFQGRFDEAMKAAKKAIELDNHYAGGYHAKGLALYQQGKLKDAFRALEVAAELDESECSQQARLWFNYQNSCRLYEAGAYQECLKKLDVDLISSPNYPLSWDLKFKCLLQIEDFGALWDCGSKLKAYYASHSSEYGICRAEKRMMEETVTRFLKLKTRND